MLLNKIERRRHGFGFGFGGLKTLQQKKMVDGPSCVCGECVVSKQQRDPFPNRKSWRAKKALELIHSDICGPITATSN